MNYIQRKICKIFILGTTGFPFGTARVEKLKLIGKSLVNEGKEVIFICNEWSNFLDNHLAVKGIHDGINYIYTSGIIKRPENFWMRRWFKMKGRINEIIILLTQKCDVAIVSGESGIFFPLFKYWIISRIKKYPIYFPYHEDEEIMQMNKGIIKRLNLILFKYMLGKILNGIFPINDFLENRIKSKYPQLPQFKIPALVDFKKFENKKNSAKDGHYFLFCGSIQYSDLINFIIEAFEMLNDHKYKLYIISFGDKDKELILDNSIKNSTKSILIKRYGYLTYENLVEMYINASAMLIPLRPSIQDIARFPHKIAEYTASERPIISTKIGIIPEYFENYKSALIAEKYEVGLFAELMQFVVDSPEQANDIGKRGYLVGREYFNYSDYGERLLKFLSKQY